MVYIEFYYHANLNKKFDEALLSNYFFVFLFVSLKFMKILYLPKIYIFSSVVFKLSYSYFLLK